MFHSVAAKQSVRLAQRRFVSSTAMSQKKAYNAAGSTKKAWLSDPSTYPLIAIMGAAGMLVLGVGSSCLMYNPDVQINPNKRGSEIRTWQF